MRLGRISTTSIFLKNTKTKPSLQTTENIYLKPCMIRAWISGQDRGMCTQNFEIPPKRTSWGETPVQKNLHFETTITFHDVPANFAMFTRDRWTHLMIFLWQKIVDMHKFFPWSIDQFLNLFSRDWLANFALFSAADWHISCNCKV